LQSHIFFSARGGRGGYGGSRGGGFGSSNDGNARG